MKTFNGSTTKFLNSLDLGKTYCVKVRYASGSTHFVTGTGHYIIGAVLPCDTILMYMEA